MAFRSPLFVLGVAAPSVPVSQGGFTTALPTWNSGGIPPIVQGGFRSLLTPWIGGASTSTGPVFNEIVTFEVTIKSLATFEVEG